MKITLDIDAVKRDLGQEVNKQVRFAAAVALTEVAKETQKDLLVKMRQVFDRPTPWVMRGTFIRAATRSRLEASVGIKDQLASKAQRSVVDILEPHFAGGPRLRKRSEQIFTRRGLISDGEYLAPGQGAKLDAYGNISRGQLQQIVSQLFLSTDPGQDKTKSARSKRSVRRAGRFFWSYGDRFPRGVWQGTRDGIKPILMVVRKPTYRQRIDLEAMARKNIAEHFERKFASSFAMARATAR